MIWGSTRAPTEMELELQLTAVGLATDPRIGGRSLSKKKGKNSARVGTALGIRASTGHVTWVIVKNKEHPLGTAYLRLPGTHSLIGGTQSGRQGRWLHAESAGKTCLTPGDGGREQVKKGGWGVRSRLIESAVERKECLAKAVRTLGPTGIPPRWGHSARWGSPRRWTWQK